MWQMRPRGHDCDVEHGEGTNYIRGTFYCSVLRVGEADGRG